MKSKKNQRLLALILSMVLMLSASISAMAEGDVQTEASGTETTENQAAVQSLEEETVPETEALTEETDTQSAEILEEPVQESAEQEITEEPAENTETPAETTEPVQEETGKPAETTETDQTIVQSPEVQEESAVTEEQPAETTEEVITEETAVSEAAELKQEFTDENGKVTQTITAYVPEGAFQATADQISMEVSFLNTSDTDYIKGMMEELLPENYYLDGYVLYQIDFKVDGEITQPAKAVTITMSGNDLAVEDTQKAHVFYYDPENPEVEGDKDQLAEVIQKDQLIKSLQESGQSTGNIEDYDYSEIAVNDGNADTITVKGWESTIYGCYVEKEAEPVTLEGSAEDIHVTLTGPASSFPEEGELTLSVKEVNKKTDKLAEKAVEEQAEKEDLEVVNYTALDITILKGGEEIQPLGPVNVTFTKEEKEKSPDSKPDQIKVFHVDEETGKAQDMEATESEEGKVEIETDHFSVYVVVDLDQLGGQIDLTVQHWATVNKLTGADGTGTTGLKVVSGPGQNQTPGDTIAALTSESVFTEIYSSDTLTLDNTLKTTAEDLSKIYQANIGKTVKNYELTEIWVLKENGNPESNSSDPTEVKKDWDTYTISSGAEIKLTGNSVIRMIYRPFSQEEALQQNVKFWDYNVTDGTGDDSFSTYNVGINAASNYSVESNESWRLAVGQASNGVYHDYAESYVPGTNKEWINMTDHGDRETTGMVTGVNKDGPIYVDGITDPGLFNDKTVPGKKIIDGYQLSFNQEGDTYTLSSVKSPNEKVLDDLEMFQDIFDSLDWQKKEKIIYSNNFWPLDKLNYKGIDPKLGNGRACYITGKRYSTTDDKYLDYLDKTNKDSKVILQSDDNANHNWFFGMRYDFEFTIGDYTGPLNYYFRGDDDFWLFVDGKLATDLGGIHSSVGKTLDLRGYLQKQEGTIDKNKTHRMTIIYAERGGSGSTCYMQFTIPNVKPVDFDTSVEKTTVTIHKAWEDHDNPNRPDSVQIKLLYQEPDGNEWKYDETSGIKTLTLGNDWTATWTGLPKGYKYKVEEVNVPDNYEVILPNGTGILEDGSDGTYEATYEATITNKADPATYITVVKKWDDGELSLQARPENVEFYLYYKEKDSEDWKQYPNGRLTLTSDDSGQDGTWKGTYENLPVYDAKGKFLEYTVMEVNGSSVLRQGATLPGKAGYKYTVHYPDKHFQNDGKWTAYEAKAGEETLALTVENSLGMKIQINKEWKGSQQTSYPDIYVGLYQDDKAVEDKYLILNQGNNWTAEFQYITPAANYTVKELRPVKDNEIPEFTIKVNEQDTGYIGVGDGEKLALSNDRTYVVGYTSLSQDNSITITNQEIWRLVKRSSSSTEENLIPLKDAEFTLQGPDNKTYTGMSDENGTVTWKQGDTEFTGIFLDGEYTLTETKAPTGYALGNSITFTIKDGIPESMGTGNSGIVKDGILTFYYDNTALYALPSADGDGIQRYITGGMLLTIAGLLVLYRIKRREVSER